MNLYLKEKYMAIDKNVLVNCKCDYPDCTKDTSIIITLDSSGGLRPIVNVLRERGWFAKREIGVFCRSHHEEMMKWCIAKQK
jgi:hypothetical protein